MAPFDRSKPISEDPHQRFWSWFLANRDHVAVMIDDQHRGRRAYERLTAEMQRVHANMVPELTRDADGTNVLVISADGHRDAVAAVIRSADAAPVVPGWRVERFRKPTLSGLRIVYQGLEVDPDTIRVAYQVDSGAAVVHIGLVIPGYSKDDERFLGIGFLNLDHTIGEYNTIMHIGRIDLLSPQGTAVNVELLTLAELRELIEERFY